jgi:hypothetical protein
MSSSEEEVELSRHALTKRERLVQKLYAHGFLGAQVVVEGIDIADEDIESGLDDDSDTSCEVTFDAYLLWSCENFQVEVRPDDDGTYRVRIDHKPSLHIRNSGCVATQRDLLNLCRHLDRNEFESAIRILFATYSGGLNAGKSRSRESLDRIVSESWIRSTYSAVEP